MISKLHSNFFINCGGSTSQDMLNLIAIAKEKVDQKFGVKLKEEVLYVHPREETQQYGDSILNLMCLITKYGLILLKVTLMNEKRG